MSENCGCKISAIIHNLVKCPDCGTALILYDETLKKLPCPKLEYCPLHAAAPSLLEFIRDIRPFLGNDPEATINKRADVLIAKASDAG